MMPAPQTAAAPLPPPPRQAQWRSSTAAASLWVPRLFLLPHAMVGLGLLGLLPLALAWLLLGVNSDATVVRTWTTRVKNQPVCHVQWDYLYGSHHHAGEDTVPCDFHEALSRAGATVPVRALYVGSLGYEALWTPLRPVVELLLFPWGFSVIWFGVLGVFGWHLYVLPARQRRLVEAGQPIEGTVSRTYTVKGKGTRRMLEYRYHPPGSAPLTGRTVVLDKERWAAAQEGAALLVLYDKDQPSRSVAYEYGLFRVRSS